MKNEDKPTLETIIQIVGSLIIFGAIIFFIGYLMYMWYTSPHPQPVHYDFSSRNIGNHIGRESGEFGKGFFRGLLGKDKGGK